MPNDNFDLRGFSLINTTTEEYKVEYELISLADAFYYTALCPIKGLRLSEDDISDCITDTSYNMNTNGNGGHDRGIDAVSFHEDGNIKIINLFNFKYVEAYNRCSNHFPSSEIDKIISFFTALFNEDKAFFNDANATLRDKVNEIWAILGSTSNYKINFYFCTNGSKEIEPSEDRRLRQQLQDKDISFKYILGQEIVETLNSRNKIKPSAKLKFIGKDYFDRSDGDIRAVIANIDVRDLIRIVLANEDMRENAAICNYGEMSGIRVLEDAFEDNIRIYQNQRGKINQNIKNTALNPALSSRFFYFNNGITITCDSIRYTPGLNSPIVTIKNLQIVNGCQTIYSLHDAFQDNPLAMENINILCKICETENKELSTNIAEYTNSQNPVNNRDIRSVDYIQKTLESELFKKGYFYERKKNMHRGKPLCKRLDSGKIGQILLSFFNEMPGKAKNNKASVFDTEYENIFNEGIVADSVILSNWIYSKIELKRKEWKTSSVVLDADTHKLESFILHSSFYLLYLIGLKSRLAGVATIEENKEDIFEYYDESYALIKSIISEKIGSEDYSHGPLFKNIKLKELIIKKLRLNIN